MSDLLKQLEKQTQENQLASKKIEMIKALRSLTKLLGRFGFKYCTTDHDLLSRLYPNPFPQSRPPWPTGKSYGWYLKHCKDAVEAYIAKNSDSK